MLQVLFRIPLPFESEWFPNGVPIYGFGMMLFCAFLICTWLAGRRGEKEGITKETIQDLAMWIFGGGLLGARVSYLITEMPTPTGNQATLAGWGEYLKNFLIKLPMIWDGGIILYGAVLGGLASYFLAYWLIFRWRGLQTRRLADAIAPSIAIGLCLGRFGCFLNGCCFGGVTCADCVVPVPAVTFPMSAPPRDPLVRQGWQTAAGFTVRRDNGLLKAEVDQVDPASAAFAAGLRPGAILVGVNDRPISDANSLHIALGNLADWPRGESRVHLDYFAAPGAPKSTITFRPRTLPLYPTQLYEVISMALLCLVLFAYEGFRRNPGQVAAVLMAGYGVHRFLNEILRDDPRPVGFERYGSLILVASGVLMWVWLQWFKKPEGVVEPVGDLAKKLGLVKAANAPEGAIVGASPIKPGP